MCSLSCELEPRLTTLFRVGSGEWKNIETPFTKKGFLESKDNETLPFSKNLILPQITKSYSIF